jgi:hypothetical protein
MPKGSTSCFRVSLIVAIASFAVVAGHADTIPSLTGDFTIETLESSNFGTGENSAPIFRLPDLPPGTAAIMFSPPANLPSNTLPCPPACDFTVTFWNGSAIGGTVGMDADIGGQFITMTGWMTGGEISGFRQIVNNPNLCCDANEWQFDFTFRGIWSNGWWSEGSSSIHISTNPPGETFGSVAMTTFATPEPGTIALLSTGIVLGWRSWRSRNRFLGLR